MNLITPQALNRKLREMGLTDQQKAEIIREHNRARFIKGLAALDLKMPQIPKR